MQNFFTLPIELRKEIYSYTDGSTLSVLFCDDLNGCKQDLSNFSTLFYILQTWYSTKHFSSRYFKECKKILHQERKDVIFEAFISICKQQDIAMQAVSGSDITRDQAIKTTMKLKNEGAKSAICSQLLLLSLTHSNSLVFKKIKEFEATKKYENGLFFLILNLSKKFEETCFYSLQTIGILELLKQSKTGICYYITAIILPFPRACKFALKDLTISEIIAQNELETLEQIKCKAEEVCDATDRPTVHV